MSDVIDFKKALRRNNGTRKTKTPVIGVYSTAGGSGKSTIVRNTAALLAGPEEPFGIKTVVFDANAGGIDQGIMGVKPPAIDQAAFSDMLFDDVSFEEYVTRQTIKGVQLALTTVTSLTPKPS